MVTFVTFIPHSIIFTLFLIKSDFENISSVHLSGLKFTTYSFANCSQIVISCLNAEHEGDNNTISSAYAKAFVHTSPI